MLMEQGTERLRELDEIIDEIRRLQESIWRQMGLDVETMRKRQREASKTLWLFRQLVNEVCSRGKEKEVVRAVKKWLSGDY